MARDFRAQTSSTFEGWPHLRAGSASSAWRRDGLIRIGSIGLSMLLLALSPPGLAAGISTPDALGMRLGCEAAPQANPYCTEPEIRAYVHELTLLKEKALASETVELTPDMGLGAAGKLPAAFFADMLTFRQDSAIVDCAGDRDCILLQMKSSAEVWRRLAGLPADVRQFEPDDLPNQEAVAAGAAEHEAALQASARAIREEYAAEWERTRALKAPKDDPDHVEPLFRWKYHDPDWWWTSRQKTCGGDAGCLSQRPDSLDDLIAEREKAEKAFQARQAKEARTRQAKQQELARIEAQNSQASVANTSLDDSDGGFPSDMPVVEFTDELPRYIYDGQFDLALSLDFHDQDVTRLYRLRVAFLSLMFEETYTSQCAGAIHESLGHLTVRRDFVTKRGGLEIAREIGLPETITYREKYREAFSQSYAATNNPLDVLWSLGGAYGEEMVKLAHVARRTIAATGCETPASALFSDNLHALALDKPSMQQRRLFKRRFHSECGAKLAGLLGDDNMAACDCLAQAFEARAPVAFLSKLENDFSFDRFVLSLAVAPELMTEARACR